MKYTIILAITIIILAWFISIDLNKKVAYPTYTVNDGRDTMARLPSGIGININMTQKEALELIANPKSGLNLYAEEIIEYFNSVDIN